ncbi:hypothetical protein [Xenorhabdus bovienii]|uniref:hypothetical protein n=1 Tax=Xenorhabdus bovienii TaxID=40576 RepID=UPI0023B22720|nr:hypothetical protein [Xenorhabdus bovienii]MDE9468446.1 hypothetical protein [Xenorhabdus bovienii]MDE9486024.1 hypothetical protein [Xenorhabdus bovienii]
MKTRPKRHRRTRSRPNCTEPADSQLVPVKFAGVQCRGRPWPDCSSALVLAGVRGQ